MEDKRQNIRRHIKAATDWLQQADKSIERKEDVQGDLKLMLAKAELQNAEKHQNRTRLIKIISFVTAATIAFGVFYFKENINHSSIEIPPSTPIVSQTHSEQQSIIAELETMPVEQNLEVDDSKPETDYHESFSTIEQNVEVNEYEPQIQISVSSLEAKPVEVESSYIQSEITYEETQIYPESVSSLPSEPDFIVSEARTPTEDMQKLMQSAGQILRAE